MKRKFLSGLLAGIILAGSISIFAAAQSSPNFDLHWNALAGGGGRQASANVAIDGILGQTAPGSAQISSSDGPLELAAGFYGPDLLSFKINLPVIMK
jgi:hypothetical protein